MKSNKNRAFNEEDIRPQKLMTDKEMLVIADREFLLSQKDQWVYVSCPACGCSESITYGKKNGFQYAECSCCETVYTNPRPSPAILKQFYRNSKNYEYWNKHIFPATEMVRREKIFRPRAERVNLFCKKFGIHDGTLLEVGAGFGTFCQEIWSRGIFERIIAVEPTETLSKTLENKGIEVINSSIEEIEGSILADIVVGFEVVEHLYDPNKFVSQCYRLIRGEGFLVLTCPNVKGFDVSMLGTLSGTFDHEHLNYFHPASLSRLLEKNNFKVVELLTPGRLDADIVRKAVLKGDFDLKKQSFLKTVLIEKWDEVGAMFQDFLADAKLSSHMWIIAKKVLN